MKSWSIAETKARLSEVVRRASQTPQFIENRGERVAVLLSAQEYERLTGHPAEPTPVQRFLRVAEELRDKEGLDGLELPPREPLPEQAEFEAP